jgi:hypothetical protein
MKTVGISPKVLAAAGAAFLTSVGNLVVQWADAGTFDSHALIAAVAAAVIAVATGAAGVVAKPGDVVPKETPAFDNELPGGVTEEQRAAALAPLPVPPRNRRPSRPKGT